MKELKCQCNRNQNDAILHCKQFCYLFFKERKKKESKYKKAQMFFQL